MDQPDDIEALRTEALRKLGRNVVNFQKIEACLKFLIAVSNVQGTHASLLAVHAKTNARIRKQPLGKLAEAFFKSIYGADVESLASADQLDIWISTSFRVEADAETIKHNKRALTALIYERNKLIHRTISDFDHNSTRSCRDLISILDPQNQRILKQLDELKRFIDAFNEHVGALQSWAGGDCDSPRAAGSQAPVWEPRA